MRFFQRKLRCLVEDESPLTDPRMDEDIGRLRAQAEHHGANLDEFGESKSFLADLMNLSKVS